jgi:hypothetical protein
MGLQKKLRAVSQMCGNKKRDKMMIEVTVNRKHLSDCINGLLEGKSIKLADSNRDDFLTLAGACYWAAVFRTLKVNPSTAQQEHVEADRANAENDVLAAIMFIGNMPHDERIDEDEERVEFRVQSTGGKKPQIFPVRGFGDGDEEF